MDAAITLPIGAPVVQDRSHNNAPSRQGPAVVCGAIASSVRLTVQEIGPEVFNPEHASSVPPSLTRTH